MDNEELILLYQQGNSIALGNLIENNKGIIIKIANKYYGINRELELDDLIQTGILGLIAAAKKYKFDIEKKAKFITYAVHYINRYINTSVNGNSSKDIGNNKFYNSCTSLNAPVGEDKDLGELGDFIEGVDYGFENIEEKVYLSKLREDLDKVMIKNNNLREREVLKFKYGWNSKQLTLQEIGEIFDIKGERVRQIEYMALRKLRNSSWVRENIKEFAELGYIDKEYIEIFRYRGYDV